MYFLDTSICIEFLRGRLTSGYQIMQEGRREDFLLPSIVVAELSYGAEHSRNPEREKGIVEAFVDAFEIVPFDAACAWEYGRLRQELAEKGTPIGERDTMIAATALARGATLVTRNLSDFSRVNRLELESWSEVGV